MSQIPKNLTYFDSLVDVVKSLRGPEGCPWDKEQTHESLIPYALEESDELAEAIIAGEDQQILDELGDVLLQVVLHSEIARQEKRFDIYDVIKNLNEKMIRRHPHVFSDTQANTSEEVRQNWDEIKKQEKLDAKKSLGLFEFSETLTPLVKTDKIGSRSKKIEFDWNNSAEVMTKVEEEVLELKQELEKLHDLPKDAGSEEKQNLKKKIEEELGDVFFTLAQIARHEDLSSEVCMRKANQKFISRFNMMIEIFGGSPEGFKVLSLEQKEQLWQKAKAQMRD